MMKLNLVGTNVFDLISLLFLSLISLVLIWVILVILFRLSDWLLDSFRAVIRMALVVAVLFLVVSIIIGFTSSNLYYLDAIIKPVRKMWNLASIAVFE